MNRKKLLIIFFGAISAMFALDALTYLPRGDRAVQHPTGHRGRATRRGHASTPNQAIHHPTRHPGTVIQYPGRRPHPPAHPPKPKRTRRRRRPHHPPAHPPVARRPHPTPYTPSPWAMAPTTSPWMTPPVASPWITPRRPYSSPSQSNTTWVDYSGRRNPSHWINPWYSGKPDFGSTFVRPSRPYRVNFGSMWGG